METKILHHLRNPRMSTTLKPWETIVRLLAGFLNGAKWISQPSTVSGSEASEALRTSSAGQEEDFSSSAPWEIRSASFRRPFWFRKAVPWWCLFGFLETLHSHRCLLWLLLQKSRGFDSWFTWWFLRIYQGNPIYFP